MNIVHKKCGSLPRDLTEISQPITRAQSYHNLYNNALSLQSSTQGDVKRTVSSHNVRSGGSVLPCASACMSAHQYNVALLTTFESERRQMEQRILHLIKDNNKLRCEMHKLGKNTDTQLEDCEDLKTDFLLTDNDKILLKQDESVDTIHEDDEDATTPTNDRPWNVTSEPVVNRSELESRIHAMEESHYSTNEELEATHAELSDLQETVTRLSNEIQQLNNEKTVLINSLSSQGEKLQRSRLQVSHLKAILLDSLGDTSPKTGDHLQLHEVLKEMVRSVDDEKMELLLLQNSLYETNSNLDNRIKELNQSLFDVRSQLSDSQKDVQLLNVQVSKASDHSLCCSLGDYEKLKIELQAEIKEAVVLREHIDTLEVDCERLMNESTNHKELEEDLRSRLDSARTYIDEIDDEITQQQRHHSNERKQWAQLQKDLQMAVVIANDIKVEAEVINKELSDENMKLSEKLESIKDKPISTIQERRHHTEDVIYSSKLPVDTTVKRLVASLENTKSIRQSPFIRESSIDLRTSHQLKRHSSGAIFNIPSASITPLRKSSLIDQNALVTVSSACSISSLSLNTAAASSSAAASNKSPKSTLTAASSTQHILYQSSTAIAAAASSVDPIADLAKEMGGSKRNALLRWCQSRTSKYKGVDITNFSSSWNDGLAFCALIHSYVKYDFNYDLLNVTNKFENFTTAFECAEKYGIERILNTSDFCVCERPDWQSVMARESSPIDQNALVSVSSLLLYTPANSSPFPGASNKSPMSTWASSTRHLLSQSSTDSAATTPEVEPIADPEKQRYGLKRNALLGWSPSRKSKYKNTSDFCVCERPNWQSVMAYVSSIY